MAIQNVPTMGAVKEYHRKNSPPWQNDIPYALNDIVFGSNGNVYKCILANNTVDPYNDPKDPSDVANELYWELASGGGGTSISEYNVNFSVADTDRKVIALSEDGAIRLASKRDFDYRPLSSIEDLDTPINYDGRYDLDASASVPTNVPWAIADADANLAFQMGQGGDNEGVRSEVNFDAETILAFASPRPTNVQYHNSQKATINGHILAYDVIARLFYILKSGATNWAEATNLNTLLSGEVGTVNIGTFGGKFVIAYWDTVSAYEIMTFNPADDVATALNNAGFSGVATGNNPFSYGWVYDSTYAYFVCRQNSSTGVHQVEPAGNTITSWESHLAVTGASDIPNPIGIKDGLIYIARKDNSGLESSIVTFNISTQAWVEVVAASMPTQSNLSNIYFNGYAFYSAYENKFYTHDDSLGSRQVLRSDDLITWTPLTVPELPDNATRKFRISPVGGTGIFLLQTDFLYLAGTTDPSAISMYLKTYEISLVETINRFKALGITSDSKVSVEPGKVSKITVQKIALLEGFTELTTGPVYMGEEGAITQDVEDLESGDWRVLLGYAVSATEVDIQMGEPVLNIPNEMLTDSVPIGAMIFVTGNIVPTGFIKADGSAHLRSLYPTLNNIYAAENYPYGNGNGSTTFNVPDYASVGTEVHAVKARYISDTSVEENGQIDNRIKVVEDAQIASDAKLALTIDPVLETSSATVDIVPEQELFMDGTSSVVTSDGRKPISGMNLGTYIPPKIEIDGKWYDNPSVKMFDDRGCFGFFEDWQNITPWRNIGDWLTVNATVGKEGDWIKIASVAPDGYAYIVGSTPSSYKRHTFLIKRGVNQNISLGRNVSTATNATYNWENDTFITGTHGIALNSVRLDEDLVVLTLETTTANDNLFVVLEDTGDEVWVSEIQTWNDLPFIPPYGQDGNPKNPARAYNFDKWDHPISFKFKPQCGVDEYYKCIINDYSDNMGILLNYGAPTEGNLLRFYVNGVIYWMGHDGVNWDGGTTVDTEATQFNASTETILQQEHDITIFADKVNNLVNVWIDGDHIVDDAVQGLSSWNPRNNLVIGGTPLFDSASTPDYYFNGYISNFCVHPKTQTLPIDQTLPYKDPNKQYGKNAQWFLDQFGGFPGAELLKGVGGIVEEGENINGKWIRFETGLLVCLGFTGTRSEYTWTFPIPFTRILPTIVGSSDSALSSNALVFRLRGLTSCLLGAVMTSGTAADMLAIGY